MHSIYRKKIVVIIVFMLMALQGFSQERIRYQPDYDNKRIHFGYFLGVVNTNYLIKYSEKHLDPNNKYFVITSPTTTGIKAGALINYYINDYFDLRFSPLTIAIYGRKLLVNDSLKFDQVDKAWFEIPVYLKYKSERRMNSRMFIFAGLKYGFETNVVNRKGTSKSFATKSADLSVDYGMGLELFREYFKITPEIHFSHGFRNMVNTGLPPTNFLNNVDRMRTHSVSFFIVFQ